jgi:hypothetical protein
MKPWQAAKKWHTENSEIPFEELLSHFFNEGYVWSSPENFILASKAEWRSGEMYVGAVEPNCWMIQLAAGENPFKRFLKLAPTKLKYVAWQRRGSDQWHVHEWDKFKRKVYKNG